MCSQYVFLFCVCLCLCACVCTYVYVCVILNGMCIHQTCTLKKIHRESKDNTNVYIHIILQLLEALLYIILLAYHNHCFDTAGTIM